jgi:hypothetical protein
MAAFPVPEGSFIITPGGPDNSLPIPPGHPALPIVMPPPPPGIWPPPASIWPPIALPPDYPMPPGSIWPPVHPPVVGGGPVVPPPGVDNTLPPGVDNSLPPTGGTSSKYLVAIVGASQGGGLTVIGYTVVDPSLSVGMPLPPAPQPK